MAPMLQTAAVCLVALLCSLQSAHGNVTGKPVKEPAKLRLAINLARAGKLTPALVQVKEDEALVTSASTKLQEVEQTDCQPSSPTNIPIQLGGMVLTYEDTSGSTPNYKNLVQTVLTKGLGVLAQQSSSGNTGWTQGFWSQNADAANLGYLMWSGSVSVGCAVTDGCEDNKFLILCLFNPTAAGDVAPFDENVYKALVARTTLLTQMTESDLQAAGSGAVMGLPSLLLAGFVAALAMVTV